VHELYLRLINLRRHEWRDRAQFFTACSYLMRNALVDHARKRGAAQRGGDRVRVTLPRALPNSTEDLETLLAIDESLTNLAKVDKDLAELAVLRYFGGLSIAEIAALRGISESSVKRQWWLARAWLRRQLAPEQVL
jgi:RNA polymerase sigma factor (TIGR02999 family)